MDALPNLPDVRWQEFAGDLKDRGFVCDAEGRWLTEHDVRRNLPAIEAKLRESGYGGGSLGTRAFDRPEEGERAEEERVLILYDGKRFDSPAAAEHTARDWLWRSFRDTVERRADDWVRRVNDIRAQVSRWLADWPQCEVSSAGSMEMHEEQMRHFKVAPRHLEAFEISCRGKRVIKFIPRGLWVIGANGRIDIVTKLGSFVMADLSEPFSKTRNWTAYMSRAHPRRAGVPFDRDLFQDLFRRVLDEAA